MRVWDLAELLVHGGAGDHDDPLVQHGDLEDLVLSYGVVQMVGSCINGGRGLTLS